MRIMGKTLGLYKPKVYRAWASMKERCSNVRHKSYPRYGGRGIFVCERWMIFENFVTDMGIPCAGMSIDRINNDEGYNPSNCRWATNIQQQNNKSISRTCEYQGSIYNARELSEATGIAYHTLRKKIFLQGIEVDKAVQPVRKKKLTVAISEKIRIGVAAGIPQRKLGEIFGVSQRTIACVANGVFGGALTLASISDEAEIAALKADLEAFSLMVRKFESQLRAKAAQNIDLLKAAA